MMSSTQQLLDIQPKELQFIFELKKQSSCAVRLTNNTFHNVAFKVKTTSPKKYCVRPNVGIISPKSTCEFTVTMQAPKAVPLEMACKDKFLIQSTAVPLGTTEKDITPDMFSKDDGKHIEEVKLKVALISPPESPVLSPINGVLNEGSFFESSVLRDPVLSTTPSHTEFKMIYDQDTKTEKNSKLKPKKDVIDFQESKPAKDAEFMPNNDAVDAEELNLTKDEELKPEKYDTGVKLAKFAVLPQPMNAMKDTFNDKLAKEVEFPPPMNAVKDVINDKVAKDAEFPPPKNVMKDACNDKPAEEAECPAPENEEKDAEFVVVKAVNELKLVSDIEEMKSKLNVLESKLNEAESTISKLTEERRLSIQERKILQEELAVLRSRTSAKKAQVGFPLLFVVMVALISVLLGYLSHR
eukprot:XP_015570407.1 vesicle-associated protein 2-2 [Ricinus communis]